MISVHVCESLSVCVCVCGGTTIKTQNRASHLLCGEKELAKTVDGERENNKAKPNNKKPNQLQKRKKILFFCSLQHGEMELCRQVVVSFDQKI